MIRGTSEQLMACEECGLVSSIPLLNPGESARCPCCSHILTKSTKFPYQTGIALSISCLIMLALSLSFPFMSFSVKGMRQEIFLLQTAQVLSENQNSLLGILLFLSVVVLPLFYILTILFLYIKANLFSAGTVSDVDNKIYIILAKLFFYIQPWIMVDVFFIGVLVSLIKISSLADISMGSSFWAFCVYSLLLIKIVSDVDRYWLWDNLISSGNIVKVRPGDHHLTGNHISCKVCQAIIEIDVNASKNSISCQRCKSPVNLYNRTENLQKSWALLMSAAIFFIPANFFPMMYTTSLGNTDGSTIIEGVLLLWNMGSYPIALVIFIASIFIPIAKMLALAWLYRQASLSKEIDRKEYLKTLKIYRVTELIGRWSMIDIFVVAILVALVQLKNIMTILPGPAALSFAAVVILTMLSAMVFDPRSLNRTIINVNNKG